MAKKSTIFMQLGTAPLLFAFFLAACAAPQPRARVTTAGGPSMAEAQSIPYDGPKARIAVSSFTIKSAKGRGQMGTGLSDMLTTELFHTNRFIVLERKQLDEVIAEQDLAATGRIKAGTEAPTGEIEGAELLVTGAVTEFEPDAGAVGGGLVLGPFPVIAGGGAKRAHIAIDMRVIDAKTSRILAATTVEGSATDIGGLVGQGFGFAPLGIGLGGYAKTPMEKAVRICLREAVAFIASQSPAQYYRHR